MCLMLGGGGMDNMMKPMFPPNAECLKHKSRIQIIGFIHLFLAMGLLITSGASMGFSSLLTVMCLFCATMNMNYCCLLIYIVYTLFDFIQIVDPVGLWIQNGTFTIANTFMGFLVAMLVFEPFAIFYAFQAYKEFKGCLQDHGGPGASAGLGGGMLGQAANQTGSAGAGRSGAQNNNYNGNGTAYGGGQPAAATSS